MSAESAAQLPVRVMRYGVDRPLPERRVLRAGPLSAVLEGGDLRYVSAGGIELVRRLYMAVRNRNWDTIEPVYTSFDVDDRGDSFTVRFTADHVKGEVDFAWTGLIEGSADGTIQFQMNGEPRRPFHKNRIGFCVLHPMSLAGTPAMVTTPEGTTGGQFPENISPHQPFIDMISIEHPAGASARCRIDFEGDLFETEDQRNWTDASYKTYSTPLRFPYPVLVEPGTPIVQTVTISLLGSVSEGPTSVAGPNIEIGTEPIGTLPPIGFAISSDNLPLAADELERIRRLRPTHLWVQIDLSESWEQSLRTAVQQAEQLETTLELSFVSVTQAGIAQVATLLKESNANIARTFVFPPVLEPVVFPRTDLDTIAESISWTREAFGQAGLNIPVGGGTRAYFTELNRASERLPLGDLDWATYTINPQVHAFDNLSLIENIEAQAATVTSARAIIGDMPLAVGPVTLRPRFNPNATGPLPEPAADELPDAVDVRQLSLFAAGWTVGSLHRLAETGANALTYFETTGWRGLMAGATVPKPDLFPATPRQLFPVYHVFAAIAALDDAQLLPVSIADPLSFEALAVRAGGRSRLLVANLTASNQSVQVSLPEVSEVGVCSLDESSYGRAAIDPAFFEGSNVVITAQDLGHLELALKPFAVACLTGRLAT